MIGNDFGHSPVSQNSVAEQQTTCDTTVGGLMLNL